MVNTANISESQYQLVSTYNTPALVSTVGNNHMPDPQGMDCPACHPSVACDKPHVSMVTGRDHRQLHLPSLDVLKCYNEEEMINLNTVYV